jgi:hypothetical protein
VPSINTTLVLAPRSTDSRAEPAKELVDNKTGACETGRGGSRTLEILNETARNCMGTPNRIGLVDLRCAADRVRGREEDSWLLR